MAAVYALKWLIPLTALSPSAVAAERSVFNVPVTRDLTGAPLPTRAEYLERHPERPLNIRRLTPPSPHRDPAGTVVLAVNSRLYNQHQQRWERYQRDLRQEGFEVEVLSVGGGSAGELKLAVIEAGGDDLAGVVFAGELPLAWFEHQEYFYGEDQPDNQRVVEYPIDLFFMDVDGDWEDTTGNGIYDWHYGSWEPDIWLGRMQAYNLSRIDEDSLTAFYLDKVHAYKTGGLGVHHRALSYVDDDWQDYAGDWSDAMRLAYGWTVEVAHPESTSASGYIRGLEDEEGYELVQVSVHSTADSHLFYINNRGAWDYFRFRDLRERVAPRTMFYNLFACSAMNPARNLCLGALYAMGGENGLGAVGTTKTGSMLFFEDYYRHLDDGASFGEALRRWFIQHGREPGHENWARSWFYGQTHYGDPTLRLRLGLRARQNRIDDSEDGDGDGVLDASESAELIILVSNRDERDYNDLRVEISCDDELVEIIHADGAVEEIAAGDTAAVRGLRVSLSPDAPDGHRVKVDVNVQTADGRMWQDRTTVITRSPRFELVNFSAERFLGRLGQGDTLRFGVGLRNSGGDQSRQPLPLVAVSLDSLLTIPVTGEIAPTPPGRFVSSGEMVSIVRRDVNETPLTFVRATLLINDRSFNVGTMGLPLVRDGGSPVALNEDFADQALWWSSRSLKDGYRDVWNWRADAGEVGGGIAFGGPDTTKYPAWADAAAELPLLETVEGYFILRHRMEVEAEYDAGVVEVRHFPPADGDSGGWVRVAPQGGYPGVSVDNGSFPGGECWNGTFDWRTDTLRFEPPDPNRSATHSQLRLRFASDGGVEGEGWYIDRLELNGRPLIADAAPPVPFGFGISHLYPNPFNHQMRVAFAIPSADRVRLGLFDIQGRRVAEIFDARLNAGRHEALLDAGALSAGVYFVRLQSSSRVSTSKAVLLK